ncbi:MAG: hypothetical protein ACJZ8I_01005 [Paracoccaceae bacterium]
MDRIIELEKKVNISLKKIKLIMLQKTKVPERSTGRELELLDQLGNLEQENKRLKKEMINLVKEHELNLASVDTLLKKIDIILEGKNG